MFFQKLKMNLNYPFITPGDLGESKFVSTSERFVTEKELDIATNFLLILFV